MIEASDNYKETDWRVLTTVWHEFTTTSVPKE